MPIFNPPLSEMDNGDLVGALAALVDEARDRLDGYDGPGGDHVEGLRLAKLADDASAWGSHRGTIGRSLISDYTRLFTSRIVDEATLGDSGRHFGAFLREHPELTEGEGTPEPLDLTDDKAILAALVQATAEWRASLDEAGHDEAWLAERGYPSAGQVALILIHKQRGEDSPLTASDRMRTVAALKRLEKAGRVEAIRREAYGQRASNDYRVREGAPDA